MRAWSELVATCNRSTTQATSYVGGMLTGKPESGAFAAACRLGLGYIILVTGNVSHDVWMDAFPANLEWLTRLTAHFIERVRIDRRRNVMSHQIFLSHRHSDKEFVHLFRDELRRRGFGTWLDSRVLVAGDELTPEIRRAIHESTHFALIWSAACVGADWIRLELNHALEAGKRIFIIRLDETSVPSEVADKLRIEAQAVQPADAARMVASHIESDERRRIRR